MNKATNIHIYMNDKLKHISHTLKETEKAEEREEEKNFEGKFTWNDYFKNTLNNNGPKRITFFCYLVRPTDILRQNNNANNALKEGHGFNLTLTCNLCLYFNRMIRKFKLLTLLLIL